MNNNNTYWTDRRELLTRAAIAEAEVAALKARIAEIVEWQENCYELEMKLAEGEDHDQEG